VPTRVRCTTSSSSPYRNCYPRVAAERVQRDDYAPIATRIASQVASDGLVAESVSSEDCNAKHSGLLDLSSAVSPAFAKSAAKAKNATAECKDGSYSTAKTKQGA
jgi:hypothetical protein